jgi:very-short-patch-repair endonuclease
LSKLSQSRREQLLAARAHAARQVPSEPERVLWAALRSSQLGVRFRRQVVIAGCIVDFFAPRAQLVVEVDGVQHALRCGADRRRDKQLGALGLRVLRLPARLVLCNLAEALRVVRAALGG